MCECTFIKDDEIERAEVTDHTHWSLLEKIVKAHPKNNFILYHFSTRYSVEEIKEFFDGLKYKNVKP